MKYFTNILILLIIGFLPGYGQNNGVYGGGPDDGYTESSTATGANNAIFSGGNDDGYDEIRISTSTHNGIFEGGTDDGYAQIRISIKTQNDIFAGGANDGYDLRRFSMSSNNGIFTGGSDDGYDQVRLTLPTNGEIFSGGIDYGYTVFTITGLPLRLPNPFPVELLSFDAWPVEDQVQIQWVTSNEVNLDKFVVERSQNGFAFEPLAEIKGQGGSQVTQPYETADLSPFTGVSYYRLKSIDLDGTEDLSRTVEVHFDLKDGLMMTAFPNPTSGIITLRIKNSLAEKVQMAVYDLAGRQVAIPVQVLDLNGSHETRIDLGNLPEGIYVLQVSSLEPRLMKAIKIRRQ